MSRIMCLTASFHSSSSFASCSSSLMRAKREMRHDTAETALRSAGDMTAWGCSFAAQMMRLAMLFAVATPRSASASERPFSRATKPEHFGSGFRALRQNSKPSWTAALSMPFVISPAQTRRRTGTPTSTDERSADPSSKCLMRMCLSQAEGPLIMLSGFTCEPISEPMSSMPGSSRPSVNRYFASPHSRTVSTTASWTIDLSSVSIGRYTRNTTGSAHTITTTWTRLRITGPRGPAILKFPSSSSK